MYIAHHMYSGGGGGGKPTRKIPTQLNSNVYGEFGVLSSIMAVRTQSEVVFRPYKLPVHVATCITQIVRSHVSVKIVTLT